MPRFFQCRSSIIHPSIPTSIQTNHNHSNPTPSPNHRHRLSPSILFLKHNFYTNVSCPRPPPPNFFLFTKHHFPNQFPVQIFSLLSHHPPIQPIHPSIHPLIEAMPRRATSSNYASSCYSGQTVATSSGEDHPYKMHPSRKNRMDYSDCVVRSYSDMEPRRELPVFKRLEKKEKKKSAPYKAHPSRKNRADDSHCVMGSYSGTAPKRELPVFERLEKKPKKKSGFRCFFCF